LLQKSCEKNAKIYVCELCDYTTSRKSSYDKHLITAKHMNTTANYISTTTLQPQVAQPQVAQPYICNCGKEYKHHSSLWNHKKKCSVNIQPTTTECENADEKDDELHNNSNLIIEILKQNQEFKEMILEKPITDTNDSLIIELLKQNQDFKNLMIEQNKYMMEQSKQMMELAKNAGNHNNNTTNTTNKFNMQIFLNETCKDAMNITEFVNSLVLTFKDLEDLGRYGYTQGITNIFTRGLQATEVSKRPIHCSDMKRLIIYINDVNGWEKDNSSQEKVIQLIKKIAGKNLRQATEWMRINHSMIHGPDSYEQRQYLKMISQWFGGTDEENVKIYNKIIRNIAPECYIDKYPALK
jgi:hypothetical protein